MRRKLFAIVLLAAGLLCSGCSSRDGDRELSTELVQEKLDIPVYDTFTGPFDFAYEMDTDAQPDAQLGRYTEDGLYYLKPVSYGNESGAELFFYDNETDISVPVCSKSDCLHEDISCDAFFDESRYPLMTVENLYIYEENLYCFCVDKGYFSVERVSMDGTERELVCRMMRVVTVSSTEDGMQSASTYYPTACIHRGYVYFSTEYTGCESAELCRVKLESDAGVETLHTISADIPQLYRLKPYGRYVFYQMGELADEEYRVDLYAFDTEEDVIYLVHKDIIRDYTVGEDTLYYVAMSRNIQKVNLTDGKEELFYKSPDADLVAADKIFVKDGKLYETVVDIYNSSTTEYELDMEGNIREIVSMDTLEAVFPCDNLVEPYTH